MVSMVVDITTTTATTTSINWNLTPILCCACCNWLHRLCLWVVFLIQRALRLQLPINGCMMKRLRSLG